MTKAGMRYAKAVLHKTIVDAIVNFAPNDEEWEELWEYVKTLAESEKNA